MTSILELVALASFFVLYGVVYFLLGAWVIHRGRKGESPIPSLPKSEPKPDATKNIPVKFPEVKP